MSGHMTVIAGNAVKDPGWILESAFDVASLWGHLEEYVLKGAIPGEDELFAQCALVCKAIVWELILSKVHVDESVIVTSEICGIEGVQLLDLVRQIEVFNKAIERPKKRKLLSWPLLVHILLNSSPEESIAILVGDNNSVAIVLLHTHLNCDPLIIWNEDHLRGRLVVILVGEEEKSGRIPSH